VRKLGIAAAAAVLLIVSAWAGPAAATLSSKWQIGPVLTPPVSGEGATLYDIAAPTERDVWVVGTRYGEHPQGYAARWDGEQWHHAPLHGDSPYELDAVDAIDRDDVWAAGAQWPAGYSAGSVPLVLRFDGRGWSAVPAPSPPGASTVLRDIDMLSTQDGWAVGAQTGTDGVEQGVILRWQEGQWAAIQMPVPSPAETNLISVHARAADDVWAVGSQTTGDYRTVLILHFDGKGWRQMAAPDPGTGESMLIDVAAVTEKDVWAVGQSCRWTGSPRPGDERCLPVALRLVDGQWRDVQTSGRGTDLMAVVVLSPVEVLAVGYDRLATGHATEHAEHWDGQRFTAEIPAEPGDGQESDFPITALNAATMAPGTQQVWAVGWSQHPEYGMPHVVRRG
jgi:hypothetical protein